MGKVGWIIIGGITVLFIALAVYNSGLHSGTEKASASVWNQQMTEGKADAPNTFIEYTDVTCPHCADFHNTASSSPFNKEYIDSGKVRMEIRVTSLLSNVNSIRAVESAYCAADQDKFFAYYDAIVKKFTKDYFDKGIGVSMTSPQVPKLDDSYYIDAATGVGLNGDEMKNCLANNKQSSAVNTATQKAINQGLTGVPAFDINNGKYTGSGFGGGYSTIQQMMKAGGVKN